jgi:hypothetical protein
MFESLECVDRRSIEVIVYKEEALLIVLFWSKIPLEDCSETDDVVVIEMVTDVNRCGIYTRIANRSFHRKIRCVTRAEASFQ